MGIENVAVKQGLSIKTRTRAIFLALIVGMAALGGSASWAILTLGGVVDGIVAHDLPRIRLLSNMRASAEHARDAVGARLIAITAEDVESARRKLEAGKSAFEADYRDYLPTIVSPQGRVLAEQLRLKWSAAVGTMGTVMKLADEGNDDDADSAAAAMRVDIDTVGGVIERNTDDNWADALHTMARSSLIKEVTTWGIALLTIGVVAGAIVVLIYFSRTVVGALTELAAAVGRLAEGEWRTPVPLLSRTDELGDVAHAVEVFKTAGIATDRRARQLNGIVAAFERAASEIVQTVASAAAELHGSAQSLAQNSETTSRRATTVAAATEQATTGVQVVASAGSQLSASIGEISRQVGEAAQIVSRAVEVVDATDGRIRQLSEAAGTINGVVGLIRSIAEQTNLLALNATIEAARAGEAGKGFAVVAAEVKTLASQTARATSDISRQIAQVQEATGLSIASIKDIGQAIEQVNGVTSTIASAVEEQDAATKEIARSIEAAARGTREVAGNIGGVTDSIAGTTATSGELLGAAGELSRQAERLHATVDRFLCEVRAVA